MESSEARSCVGRGGWPSISDLPNRSLLGGTLDVTELAAGDWRGAGEGSAGLFLCARGDVFGVGMGSGARVSWVFGTRVALGRVFGIVVLVVSAERFP